MYNPTGSNYYPEPTVVPFSSFNPAEDAAQLRAAMKGFGTDEQKIIDILTRRANFQRQAIAAQFSQQFGRDLVKDLKSELSGKFEDVIVGIMLPPDAFVCKQLNKAMAGLGTDETALIEILCPRQGEEMKRVVRLYEEMYNRPLVEHLCSETSGDFRRILTLIATGARDPAGTVDQSKAREQAQKLFEAGEARLGTDENVFVHIFGHASFDQLRLIFDAYKAVSGMTIEQSLKHEMSGDLRKALETIVECVQSIPTYFARRLFKSLEGAGTDDKTLIRIVVSRCEVDLGNIKREFERMYNKTLVSMVKSDTSGDYKKALCALIGAA